MQNEIAKRVHAVFAEALGKPAEERAAFLAAECGGNQQLLHEVKLLLRSAEADTADSFLSPLPFNVKSQLDASELEDPLIGQRLGAYEVRERIGQGGMGNVYLGMRVTDYEQPVAIKVIKRGMDTEQILRRFRHEMQFSAVLSKHPNIAAMLDAGTTADGRPYFVMEYVDGDRIDRYCDQHRLPVPERLKLMRQVCSAVQYAHQRTVIHRDLKPSNILVTAQGIPKLIDFGIAKLTDPEGDLVSIVATETEQRLLTPEYASPEQIRGETITTATDVYSLGVILYELLSGRKPYRLTSQQRADIERVIAEEEPKRPSTAIGLRETVGGTDEGTTPDQISSLRGEPPRRLRRMLHGDLDNIILMALRKEPDRRYASVEQLSADLQNYLQGHPVSARAATWRYRTAKYIRRNRVLVGAAAVVLLTLVGGIVASTSQAIRAARQAERAEQQAALADAINQFLVDDFIRASDPNFYGDQGMSMYEAVQQAADRLKGAFDDQPETKAKLHRIFAESLLNLGRYEEVLEQCDLASEFYDLHPSDSRYEEDAVTVLGMQGDALDNLSRYDEAEELLDQAYRRALESLGERHKVTLRLMARLGETQQTVGKYEAAEPLLRRAHELAMEVFEPQESGRYTALNSLAECLRAQERHSEAEPLREQFLELTTRHYGPQHPDSLNAMNQIASLYFYQAAVANRGGDEAEATRRLRLAEPVFRQLFAAAEQVLPSDHRALATYQGNHGVTLAKLKRYSEAEPVMVEAYHQSVRSVGEDSDDAHWYLKNVVKFYEVWSDKQAAETARQELDAKFAEYAPLLIHLCVLRANVDDDDDDTASWWIDRMMTKVDRPDAALDSLLAELQQSIPEGNRRANYLGNLGIVLARHDRIEPAEAALLESLRLRTETLGNGDEETQWMLRELVQLYEQHGREAEADRLRGQLE